MPPPSPTMAAEGVGAGRLEQIGALAMWGSRQRELEPERREAALEQTRAGEQVQGSAAGGTLLGAGTPPATPPSGQPAAT